MHIDLWGSLVADSKGKSNAVNLTTAASESCFRFGLQKCAEITADQFSCEKMLRFSDHKQRRGTKITQHLGDAKLESGESAENVCRVRTMAGRHVERGAFAPEEQGQRGGGAETEQDHNRFKKKKKNNFQRRKGSLQSETGGRVYAAS